MAASLFSLARIRRRKARRENLLGILLCIGVFAIGLWVMGPVQAAQDSVASAAPLRPSFFVIDGDTIGYRSSGLRVRIANIDTPEIHEPGCAAEAAMGYRAKAMTQSILTGAQRVQVHSLGRFDRYGRELALVSADGHDIGDALVTAGLARTWEGRRRPWCRVDGSVGL